MTLKQAGYRERVYSKAYCAKNGISWSEVRESATYNPSTDCVSNPVGKVKWEGAESVRILSERGLNDKDCY
jgi:hypothetical protein